MKVAVYLYEIKEKYLDFASANKSAACTKVPEISTFIAEL